MQGIRKQLADERGASVLIALLFFLVGTMVSVVILSTATTALKRVDNDRQREQEYFAVSSAARLVRDCLEESACTVTTVETRTFSTDGASSSSITGPTYKVEGDHLGELVKHIAVQAEAAAAPAEQSYTVRIPAPSNTLGDAALQECTLTFSLTYDADASTITSEHYTVNGIVEPAVPAGTAEPVAGQVVYLSGTLEKHAGLPTSSTSTSTTVVGEGENATSVETTTTTTTTSDTWGFSGLQLSTGV